MCCSVQPGQQLDRYFVERELACSGMATIFRGTDARNGRPIIIKVPHMEAESDVVFFQRFRREQEIGQKLEHPGQLEEIIRRAMARDLERRYPTAKDMAYDLEHRDDVKLVECAEMPGSGSRHASWHESVFTFAPLALISLLMFTILFIVTRHP